MAWTVAPNIKALFASVNKLAPTRDKASDGTIGDYAHSTGVSGHNPDDTSGTRAERTDADTVAEVRAGDVDKDLRVPGLTLEQVVQTVVRTPALRNRLIYVIYNRRIWSASNGWRQQAYSGSNPHDKHAHFSGHPDYDNNSAPWREIEQLGEAEDMTPEEHAWLATIHRNLTVLDGRNPVGQIYTRMAMGDDATVKGFVSAHPTLRSLGTQMTAMQTALLGAVQGLDTKAILARIDAVAKAETARDQAAAQRDADLAELIRASDSGELTAEQVLTKLRDLLPAGTQG